MFHIKISSTLQHRGLSLLDCQGFGFQQPRLLEIQKHVYKAILCALIPRLRLCRYKECPWHPHQAHAQGNSTCTEAWPVSLTCLGCQKPTENAVPTWTVLFWVEVLSSPPKEVTRLHFSEGRRNLAQLCLCKCKHKNSSPNCVHPHKEFRCSSF